MTTCRDCEAPLDNARAVRCNSCAWKYRKLTKRAYHQRVKAASSTHSRYMAGDKG